MINKKETFTNCSSLEPRAIMALGDHLNANPNGMPLFGGKSRSKTYYGLYSIHETATQIVVNKIGD